MPETDDALTSRHLLNNSSFRSSISFRIRPNFLPYFINPLEEAKEEKKTTPTNDYLVLATEIWQNYTKTKTTKNKHTATKYETFQTDKDDIDKEK